MTTFRDKAYSFSFMSELAGCVRVGIERNHGERLTHLTKVLKKTKQKQNIRMISYDVTQKISVFNSPNRWIMF